MANRIEVVGRMVAGRPSTRALEAALVAFQLQAEDVAWWQSTFDAGIVLVTERGRSFRWPAADARISSRTEAL
jgi:hypothetical protein